MYDAKTMNHHDVPSAAVSSIAPLTRAIATTGRPARRPAIRGTGANGKAISLTRNATAKIAPARTPHRIRVAADRRDADGNEQEGERCGGNIEASRSRQVVQVCEAEQHRRPEGTGGRPEPPAEPGDEEEEPDARDPVEDMAPRQGIDPGQDAGPHHHHRPQRRVIEERAIDRDDAMPGQDVRADPQVLRLVKGREERWNRKQEGDEHDAGERDGDARYPPFAHRGLKHAADRTRRAAAVGRVLSNRSST